MSAIAGYFSRVGAPADERLLNGMADALARWGSHRVRSSVSGPVALVQLARAARPEGCHASDPTSESRRFQIVADVRLDNREELGSALGLDVSPDHGVSDERLILEAYERWGNSCPERLLGDFAFAIWDGERQILFCARDPVGVRSLYYHLSPSGFAFATQIKALLQLPDVPRRLDEETLGDYLALLPPDKERTFYRGIVRLRPGSALEASRGSSSTRRYWELDDSRELRLGSDHEYAEAFRAVFTEAVRARITGSPRPGFMLSGGLDSSSIVCAARTLTPGERLVTLSGTFPSFRSSNGRVDETDFIELVVAGGGVDPHYVPADNTTPLFEFLWEGEEPLPAASLYMDWQVLRAAHQLGLQAIMSGNDGDTVVGYGLGALPELAWTLRWITLRRELAALSERHGVKSRKLFARFVLPAFLPWPLAAARARLRRGNAPIYDSRSFIRRDFASRVGVIARARDLHREERARLRERSVHRMNMESSLLTVLLEILGRSAAEFAIEPRYPFMDRRVLEFCLAIPAEQKLHQGWDRTVMRRAMEGLLPPEIQWRKHKQNLSLNFNLRLLGSRELMDEIVLRDSAVLEPYLDVARLRTAYEAYLAKPERTRKAFSVFWAVVFGLWLRHSGLSAG